MKSELCFEVSRSRAGARLGWEEGDAGGGLLDAGRGGQLLFAGERDPLFLVARVCVAHRDKGRKGGRVSVGVLHCLLSRSNASSAIIRLVSSISAFTSSVRADPHLHLSPSSFASSRRSPTVEEEQWISKNS